MINFGTPQMCQICEQPIKLGGILLLPGSNVPRHLCFGCAIQEVKEYNKAQGLDTKDVQVIRLDKEQL